MATEAQTIKWRLAGPLLWVLLGFQIWLILRTDPFAPARQAHPDADASALPIAELVTGRNSIRIQNAGELIWSTANSGEPLLDKQSLLTLEDSRADVAFLDGTGLVVEENSLIQITRPPGNARIFINLLRGSVQKRRAIADLKKGPELVITAGNSQIISKPGSEFTVTMTPESIGGAKLFIHKGEASVIAGDAKPSIANLGETVEIARLGSADVPVARRNAFHLRSPRGGDPLKPTSEFVFEWSIDVNQIADSPQEIEVSTDPEFIRDTRKKMINATYPPLENARASFFLPPTDATVRWYWRVRALSKQLMSPTETFMLEPDPRPAPLLPSNASVARAGLPIDFAWSAVKDAENYEIQVTSTRNTASADESKQTQTSRLFARIPDLPLGEWKWQVRARFPGGVAGRWSAARRFTVITPPPVVERPKDYSPPPPPKLQEPEIEKKSQNRDRSAAVRIAAAFLDLLPAAHADDLSTNIKLRWEAVTGASAYRLQISRKNTFTELLIDETVTESQYLWSYRPGMENTKGRVFYRVATVGKDGKSGAFSGVAPMLIPAELRTTAKSAVPPKPPVSSPSIEVGPAAPAETVKSVSPRHLLRILGTMDLAFRGTKQSTTDPAMRTVRVAPYLSQHASFSTHYRDWMTYVNLSAATYKKTLDQPTLAQPKLAGFALDGMLLRSAILARERSVFVGASLGWRTRWIKTGPQTLGTRGGSGLGPAILLVRNYTGEERPELGAILELPVSGLAGSGYAGAILSAWRELNVFTFDNAKVSLRLTAEASALHWSEPVGTWVQSWGLSAGPVVRCKF